MASGVYNAGFALGEVIGPIGGSMLTGYLGFRTTYALFAALVLVYIIPLTYAFFCHKESWNKKSRQDVRVDDDQEFELMYTPLLGVDERAKRIME